MKDERYLTGIPKAFLYLRIGIHVTWIYWKKIKSLKDYLCFIRRAAILLLTFRHNKAVRISTGYKLDIYVPAYPSKAFFHVIDAKLLMRPPGPSTVVFSITKACSYHCAHCYQHMDGGHDLDEKLMIETAREMQDCGVAFFNVEGGEPFLRLERLENLLNSLDERAEIWVNTTGSHLSSEIMERLKKLRMHGVMISIHSTESREHDEITGVPGSYEKAVDAFKMFKAAGFGTVLNSVLSEKEIHSGGLNKLMELARSLDCDYVQLIHPKPAGGWLGKKKEMQNDPEIISFLRDKHLRYNSQRMKDFPCLSAQVFEESEKVFGCTAGAVDRFYINANGEIQPCEFLNISFGNVQTKPFKNILAEMREYFKTPSCSWLCCTLGPAVYGTMLENNLKDTPVQLEHILKLVETRECGKETPLYRKLGIYK